jgi:hypothetical protein
MEEMQVTSTLTWIEVPCFHPFSGLFQAYVRILTYFPGAIHEEGRGGAGQVPDDAQVDIRDGVLSRKGQPEGLVRGQSEVHSFGLA